VCFGGGGGTGGTWSNFAGTFAGARGGIAGFMAALVAALWAYDGWNDLNMVAGEIKHPEKSIPVALIAGVAIVGVLYVLVNAGVQYVLPAVAIAESVRPASDAVALVVGRVGAGVVSAGMALSMLVTLNGTVMSGARVPFAVARDGYFFHTLAKVHPRFHTPSVAIVVQAALSILLLLLGANFRQLFSLAIFAEWLFYMIAGSTIFVFRSREPQAARPYRMGISSSARRVRNSSGGTPGLHLQERLAEFRLRIAGNSGGRSSLRGVCLENATVPSNALDAAAPHIHFFNLKFRVTRVCISTGCPSTRFGWNFH